jgi:Calcium-activated chloride channel
MISVNIGISFYTEAYIQFGFITMFTILWPLAPLYAFAANMIVIFSLVKTLSFIVIRE